MTVHHRAPVPPKTRMSMWQRTRLNAFRNSIRGMGGPARRSAHGLSESLLLLRQTTSR